MKKRINIKDMVLVSLFAVLMSIGARLSIPLPVVPFTMQFLFCALSGVLLGPRLGAISMGLYVFMGLIGLPVFAKGGGFGYVLSPTFGYLLGFIAASFIIGVLSGYFYHKRHRLGFLTVFVSILAGFLAVYVLGISWLFVIKNYYLSQPGTLGYVLGIGFVPFIGGDMVQSVIAAIIGVRLLPLVKTRFIENSAAQIAKS